MAATNPSPVSARRLILAIVLIALVVGAVLWWSARRRATEATVNTPGAPAGATAPATTVSTGSAPAPDSTATSTPPAPAGFQAAADAARAIRDPRRRSITFGRVYQHWLDADVDGAIAYLRTLPHTGAEFSQALLMVTNRLAARDPQRALRLAAELVSTREQQIVYNALFAEWAQRDPLAAAARLESVPADAGRENAIRALAETWAQHDFKAAFAWATQAPTSERSVAVESALSALVVIDPSHAIELARQTLSGPALERTLTAALERLVVSDAQAAAGVVSSLSASEVPSNAAAQVAQALAAKDPAAAMQWANTLPDGNARKVARARALEVWAARDPNAAAQYVSAMPAGSGQQDAVALLAWRLGRDDAPQAIAWATSLPAEAGRAAALARVADGWATRDPAGAAHWIAGEASDQLGQLAPSTLNAALSYWVLKDPAATGDFVRLLSPTQQAAAAEFVAPLLAQQDPAQALRWAESLPAAQAHDTAITAAYQRWVQNAPAAAQAWLSTATLTPELKARLQSVSR